MTIAFTELDGSPTYNVKQDSVQVTRQLKVAWADRAQFVREILASYDIDQTNARCFHTLVRPMPGAQKGSGSVAAYDYAVVECNFSTAAMPIVSEEMSPSAEFITLDYRKFKWGDDDGDPLVAEEAPGKLCVTLDYIQTWKNLQYVPEHAFYLMGHVNSTAINMRTHVNIILIDKLFSAESLLYHPPMVRRTWDVQNSRFSYDLTYRFTYRPNWDGTTARGWNWWWRASTGKFEQIYSTETAAVIKNYPVTEFRNLFI